MPVTPVCAESATPTTHQAKTQELAERCLRSNPYLALKNVACDYQDGVVILRGCLPTYYLKQVAQEVVAHQQGVDRVENQIEVVATACQPVGAEAAIITAEASTEPTPTLSGGVGTGSRKR